MQASPILDMRGVSKVYRRGRVEVAALRDVSFRLTRGSTLAIMGPSGSGKTTLLNVLAGLDRPTGGEVLVDGQRLDRLDAEAATAFRRRHIGFVFQFFNLLPTMSARENVALPLGQHRQRHVVAGGHRREAGGEMEDEADAAAGQRRRGLRSQTVEPLPL